MAPARRKSTEPKETGEAASSTRTGGRRVRAPKSSESPAVAPVAEKSPARSASGRRGRSRTAARETPAAEPAAANGDAKSTDAAKASARRGRGKSAASPAKEPRASGPTAAGAGTDRKPRLRVSRRSEGPGRRPRPEPVSTPVRTEVMMTPEVLHQALVEMADAIRNDLPDPAGMLVLGIQTRGAVLARRLRELLNERYGVQVGYGHLDITLYRDDLSTLGPQPEVGESDIPFDVHGARIILVDDVLFTGRTIRAALDEIVDFGRPALIRLAVLMDRGLREYPIQPDYWGMKIVTEPNQLVRVLLSEVDGEDGVFLLTKSRGDH